MDTSVETAQDRHTQTRPLAGFWHLFRFMARRDRLRAPVWIVSVVGLIAASIGSVVGLYDTQVELEQYAELATADAALKALAGPGHGLDNPTTGAVVMNEILVYTFVGIALMCIFLMIRHTRAEEETDRAELVRAATVGRLATLAAACLWVTLIDGAVAIGIVLSLLAFGLPSTGALAFGAAAWGIGLVFLGVAATTAQVASSARAATAGAGVILGASFMMRAVGDLGNGWMTWLSPLGWAQSMRAFADERWWVLAPLGVAAILLVGSGVVLSSRRDLGAGLLKQRPGAAEGRLWLGSPVAMAVRLQRTSLLSWMVGIALIGFFFGIVADQADEILENEAFAEIYSQAGVGTPTEAFLAITVLFVALIASGFTVSTVLRLRTEESAGRASAVMATPVSRWKWVSSYLAVSVVGTVLVMAASGLTIGVGYAAQLGESEQILPVLGAALAIVPALLVLAAVTVALVGVRPSLAPVAWLGVVVSATVGLLAETLNLPQWFRNISPFQHVPAMPAAPFDVVPLVILLLVAVGVTAVGMVAMSRRDIG